MKTLAQSSNNIWGEITPPGSGSLAENPVEGLGKLVSFGVRMFLLVSGAALLVYLLWGAFDYITSGGDKEKVSKAVSKMTNAVIGILILFAIFAIYGALVGDILGIIKKDPTTGQWLFSLPRLE